MSPDLKSTIDKLFDEDLFAKPDLSPEKKPEKKPEPLNKGLPKIDPGSNHTEVIKTEEEPAVRPQVDGDGFERREFNRAELLEEKIEVKFRNSAQFAKQYIENISVGGLFVRTEQKYQSGDIIPISFQVGNRTFDLKGKVCRIRKEGVGLEFIDLNSDIRADLETFVQSTLPKGTDLKTKARQSTINRLNEIREKQALESKKRKDRLLKTAIIVILLALNSFMLLETMVEEQTQSAWKEKKLTMGGQEVYEDSIRSIKKNKDGKVLLTLENDNSILISEGEAERVLPMHLRHTYQLIKTTPIRKKKRISKTNPRNTRLR